VAPFWFSKCKESHVDNMPYLSGKFTVRLNENLTLFFFA